MIAVNNAFGNGTVKLPQWSTNLSLSLMDQVGIKSAVLSLTVPGVTFLEQGAPQQALARQVNEYTASIRDSNPSRFGFFATVPTLFDTAGVLAEIKYSLDVLKADGICFFTRYGSGDSYLGQPAFRPIWAELNARKAIVFIHPTYSKDGDQVNPYLLQPNTDFTHETTRTVLDLITTGTKAAFPDVKVILSHAGGTVPFVIERSAHLIVTGPVPANFTQQTIDEVLSVARSFYYDLAVSSTSIQLSTLLQFVGPEKIVYGSDFPYANNVTIDYFDSQLEVYEMNTTDRNSVYYGTAMELMPRFKD